MTNARFNLPDLGEGLQEAEIVRWHVAIGDPVKVDDPLVAVETAKAVVEVPSPHAGRVTALHGKPGDTVAVGAPLVDFASDAAPGVSEGGAIAQGTVVGHMPVSDEELAAAPQRRAGTGAAGSRPRAVPAAREFAKRLGLDLATLTGTGRDGLITVDDVMAAGLPAASAPAPASASAAAANLASAMKAALPPALSAMRPAPHADDGELEVLRSLRRAMAQSMALARDNVMECTVSDDADIEGWQSGADYTVRLLRAIAAGCKAEPGLNAWFDANAQGRRLFNHIDVGIAVDTPDGLLVPVIRDVGNRGAAELRAEINRLKVGARDRTLPASDLRDFTFMLSNFGVMAGRYATPVVVPPAVAILGAGRVSRDVVAVDDRIEAHRRIPLSLTFDHRCVTGGEAVRLLGAVIADLQRRD
jgi:pyruvate dehydrogenase E2 component (dihydrolipoamide acetyltransferase)